MTDEPLAWTTPASRRRPVIFLVALLAAVLGELLLRQPLIALLGAAMVLGATADHWLGTCFRLDAKGASARIGPSVTAMEWTEVHRILVKEDEIRLSPLESASPLDPFRGVGLVTTPENHETVLAFVKGHAPEAPLH